MAVKYEKNVQVMDLGTYAIKYGVFKVSKNADEVEPVSKEIYKIPNSYSGAEIYMETFGQYLKDIAPNLDKKLPIKFTFSSLFAPTNLSYLTRVDKDKVQERMKDELDKFATQEKIPSENQHNKVFEMFRKEMDQKCQVVVASILCNPKYVGIIKKHLYSFGLKFGGIYPNLQSCFQVYERMYSFKPEWKDEPVVSVDIGHLTTKVNLFFQEKLVFHKVLHYGTRNFYEELFDFSSKTGDTALSPQEVESILQKVGFTGDIDLANQIELDINDVKPYLEQIDTTIKSMFTKINSSINYFISALARNFTADNTAFMTIRKGASHVLFTGGVTAAPGFLAKASENMGAKPHLFTPFDFKGCLEQTDETFQQDDFIMNYRENNAFAECASVAILALDNQKNYVNLVSQVDSENDNIIKVLMKMPLSRYRTFLIFGIVAVLLNLGWTYWMESSKLSSLKKKKSQLSSSISDKDSLRNDFGEIKKKEMYSHICLDHVFKHVKNHVYWPGTLKKLIQKLDSEIKLTAMEFKSSNPGFSFSKYRRWLENPDDKKQYPWEDKTIEFKIKGDALSRLAVPKLIKMLTETAWFSIPKPPNMKFVDVQEVRKRVGNNRNQEQIEIIAAHYEFELEGFVTPNHKL
jgi:hypothetical protein